MIYSVLVIGAAIGVMVAALALVSIATSLHRIDKSLAKKKEK